MSKRKFENITNFQYYKDNIQNKKQKVEKEDNNKKDFFSVKTKCAICKIDLGENNPRQLCGKTYCMFEAL